MELFYSEGPDRGIFRVYLDGKPYKFEDGDDDLARGEVDAYRKTVRWNIRLTIEAQDGGQHTLIVRSTGARNAKADGTRLDLGRVEVLPPARQFNLPADPGHSGADRDRRVRRWRGKCSNIRRQDWPRC